MKFADSAQMPCVQVKGSPSFTVRKLDTIPLVQCTNSICFSPDGKTMYHCDTPTKVINAYDYSEQGEVTNPRIFYSLLD
jgi:hypothetical protein